MKSLYEQVGGEPTLETMVDRLYARLTTDPVVQHHFLPHRVPEIKRQQRRWFRSVLGGSDESDRPDLEAAHRDLDITDEDVRIVLGHLDGAFEEAGVGEELRVKINAVVARLWYARHF